MSSDNSPLLSLSGDALCHIFSFVKDSSLARLLLLSGCRTLLHKVAGSPMSLNHELSGAKGRTYSPKALISCFPKLTSLRITAPTSKDVMPYLLDFEAMVALPRTLVDLELSFGRAMDCFSPVLPWKGFISPFLLDSPFDGHTKLFNVSKLFPNLESLHVSGGTRWSTREWSDLKKITFLEDLPRSLRSFSMPLLTIAGEYDVKRHILSKNLESLNVHTGNGPSLNLSHLSQLKSLSCSHLKGNLVSLPPKLTELDVQYIYPGVDILWPQTLTKLSVWPTSALRDSKWLSSLPTHITDLRIMIAQEIASSLPPHLRKLELFLSTPLIDFSDLPRGLTSLYFNNGYTDPVDVDLSTLPPNLKTLRLNFDGKLKLQSIASISSATDLMLPVASQEIFEDIVSSMNPNIWRLHLIMDKNIDSSTFSKIRASSLHHLAVKRMTVKNTSVQHLFGQLHTLDVDIERQNLSDRATPFVSTLPPLLKLGYDGSVQ